MMKQNIIEPEELTLAAILIGIGNDWTKHHDIDYNIEKICNSIKNNKVTTQDIGIAKFVSNNEVKLNISTMWQDWLMMLISKNSKKN
ncbi:MAG: hypothetical protein R2771_01750 [Saprospiraceae bacterium]